MHSELRIVNAPLRAELRRREQPLNRRAAVARARRRCLEPGPAALGQAPVRNVAPLLGIRRRNLVGNPARQFRAEQAKVFALDTELEIGVQRLANRAPVLTGGMHDQRCTWPKCHGGEDPFARPGLVVAQRPAGEVHGGAPRVAQLDPVAGLALLVLQAVAVGREKLVDHHQPKVVLGVDVVMPSLCREPVRLRRKIGHAVVRHPGDRHETIVSRGKLDLPRPARHPGDG